MVQKIIREFLDANPNALVPGDVPDKGESLRKLIQWLCPHGIVIGGIYRHFKGNQYRVTGLTRDADDWEGELRVKYVNIYDVEHEATRILSDFTGTVERDGSVRPRFQLIRVS